MSYVLLATSLTSIVLQNCLFNNVGKKALKNQKDILYYHSISYLVCIVLFLFLTIRQGISLFSILIGSGLAVMTVLINVYTIKAYQAGPMHMTVLFTVASTIIPSISGVFIAGETFSFAKMVGFLILLCFIYLSLNKSNLNSGMGKKWFLYSIIVFLTNGGCGVIQKIHQTSNYREEIAGALFSSFVISYICARFMAKGKEERNKFETKHYVLALICGVCTFTMHFLNLKLSGIIPSQIFFPVINGGGMVLTSVASVILFKEKLLTKQVIGIIGSMGAIIYIGLV